MSVITAVQSLMMLSKGGAPSEDALLFSLLAAHCYQEEDGQKDQNNTCQAKGSKHYKETFPSNKVPSEAPQETKEMKCYAMIYAMVY